MVSFLLTIFLHHGVILTSYFVPEKPKRVYADLRIVGPNLDPVKVTSLLDLTPTGTSEKGHLEGLSGKPCPDASWFLSTEADPSINMDHHLQMLIELLTLKIEILQVLKQEGHNLSISCYVLTCFENVESHISHSTLQALAQLPCNFWTDVYFDIDE